MKKIITVISLFLATAAFGVMAAGVVAPSTLSASAVSTSQINLIWQDKSSNEAGFKIERSLNGSNFSEIGQVSANITSYSDSGLSKATTYYYRVRAFTVSGKKTTYSGYSNIAWAKTFDIAPVAPSDLTAQAVTSTSTPYVWLNWLDNSDNETGFNIEKSVDGIIFSEIYTTAANVVSYYDRNIQPGQTYYYRVRARNNYGNSDYSNTVQILVP